MSGDGSASQALGLIKTTVGYARVAVDLIRQVQSPLEHLNLAATAPD